ncbi:hypothetical protein TNCV_4397561 [Trichonephila clavipes]|nr:hypothetical protein TNCV_4397561 [Trichonephila clavipes]
MTPELVLSSPNFHTVPTRRHLSVDGVNVQVSEEILTSQCSATLGLLATDLVILSPGQMKRTTPELAPLLLTTTPHQRQEV